MDKITFDFENNTVEIANNIQQGTITDLQISERKNAILAAAGLCTVDLSESVDMINALLNGEISPEDFAEYADRVASEEQSE